MNLNNKVIEVLDYEHGQKVRKFFISNGVNTKDFGFTITKSGGGMTTYYGFINGVFQNYSLEQVSRAGAEIINLNNMTQLTIEIPYGHEVDIENSDLAKGVVKFKPKKALPTKWEDLRNIRGYYVSTGADIHSWSAALPCSANKNLWPTEELAKASLALCQLVRLRDIYNDGWQPDWTDHKDKYVIEFSKGKKIISTYLQTQCVLAFKDKETRDLFFNTFKDLIEEAKPLL